MEAELFDVTTNALVATNTPFNTPIQDTHLMTQFSSPKLTIALNYSEKSHVLFGYDLKTTYSTFRTEVLREADWANWKGRLVKDPRIEKGWMIKKEALPKLIEALTVYCIPYDTINTQEVKLTPKQKFEKENLPVVMAAVPAGTSQSMIKDTLTKMWKKERGTIKPRTAYLLWCSDNKQRIMASTQNHSIANINKLLGQAWRNETEEVKEQYKRLANERVIKPQVENSTSSDEESPVQPNPTTTTTIEAPIIRL